MMNDRGILNMVPGTFDVTRPIAGQRLRASSYDLSGGNRDYFMFEPGESKTLLLHEGNPGSIQRIWFTLNTEDPDYLANTRISMSFDEQETVCRVPIGMFCSTGPWAVNDVCTQPVSVMRTRKGNEDQPGAGVGSFNLAWRMPFAQKVRISLHNDSRHELMQHFHVDYLIDIPKEKTPYLFHASYNCSTPTRTAPPDIIDGEAKNLSDADNYKFAMINGYEGNYAGTVLAVESHPDRCGKWYEGDDMFFIDGEAWPPSVHGTGTEDYFGMAWGIHRKYQSWDHGVTHYERKITGHDRFYDGRFTLFRWHLADPIPFRNSLHASIEAGHANDCEQHYESVAFWYGRRIEQAD